jgi:thioredoxin reductase
MDDGSVFFGRTTVIATGACYNKPTAVDLECFPGSGIQYGATNIEAQLFCRDSQYAEAHRLPYLPAHLLHASSPGGL